MPIYEVGTFEKHEAGFHAFYRVTNKVIAEQVKTFVQNLQAKTPAWDTDFTVAEQMVHMSQCDEINDRLQDTLGIEFNITGYSKELYTIEVREVELNEPKGRLE